DVVPLCWSMDHVGPMTRNVSDTALMFEAIVGHDANDPWSVAMPPIADDGELQTVEVDGMRLGIVRTHFFEGDPTVIRVVDQAIEQLVAHGAKVVELELPDIETAYAACRRVFLEAAALHAEVLKTQPENFSDAVREKLIAASRISGLDYAADQDFRQAFRVHMDGLLDRCDVLVTPTACVSTPEIGALGDDFFRFSPRNTNISDFTGQPSISLPCGFDSNSMPVGLMLTGRRFDDWHLLSRANAVEGALGVAEHPPGY
ncbi:MAG: amidase, partial [Pseudomonadota bacterium]